MNVPNDDLTRWRTAVHSLLSSVRSARLAHQPHRQSELLQGAEQAAVVLLNQLEQAGAEKKEGPPRGSDIPLQLLDTPANRRYRDALLAAWEAGLAVDRERYGEKIGTDGCAQVIEMVLADVEQEIGGATSRIGE